MTQFRDGAPLRLSLRSGLDTHTPGDRLEDAGLSELIGHFNCYDVAGGRIHFYMHPPIRKSVLLKALRSDRRWLAFKRDNPDVELTWAEDLAGVSE